MTIFYTGKGDKGKSMLGKCAVNKDDPIFEALGALDELNCWIGYCRNAREFKSLKFKGLRLVLKEIQETLFIAQAEIASIAMGFKSLKFKVSSSKTQELEKWIDEIDKKIPTIKNFIIPGASELSARLDVARAISRRVERAVVRALKAKETKAASEANEALLTYLNRLSSILFALARLVNFRLHLKEENPSYK